MDFKGTKGKWSYTKTKKGHYKISGKVWTDFAKVNTVTNADGEYDLEAKANALLISKALEMLEMLQEIYTHQENGEANDKHLRKRVLSLIKQATEI